MTERHWRHRCIQRALGRPSAQRRAPGSPPITGLEKIIRSFLPPSRGRHHLLTPPGEQGPGRRCLPGLRAAGPRGRSPGGWGRSSDCWGRSPDGWGRSLGCWCRPRPGPEHRGRRRGAKAGSLPPGCRNHKPPEYIRRIIIGRSCVPSPAPFLSPWKEGVESRAATLPAGGSMWSRWGTAAGRTSAAAPPRGQGEGLCFLCLCT